MPARCAQPGPCRHPTPGRPCIPRPACPQPSSATASPPLPLSGWPCSRDNWPPYAWPPPRSPATRPQPCQPIAATACQSFGRIVPELAHWPSRTPSGCQAGVARVSCCETLSTNSAAGLNRSGRECWRDSPCRASDSRRLGRHMATPAASALRHRAPCPAPIDTGRPALPTARLALPSRNRRGGRLPGSKSYLFRLRFISKRTIRDATKRLRTASCAL